MSECKHIYGFKHGTPGFDFDFPSILVESENSDVDVIFKYCPLCGIELPDPHAELNKKIMEGN